MTPEISAAITDLVQWGFSVRINSIDNYSVLFDCMDGNTEYTVQQFCLACETHGVKLEIWRDKDRVFGAFYK